MISKILALTLLVAIASAQVDFMGCTSNTYTVNPSVYLSRTHSSVYPQNHILYGHEPMVAFHLFISQGPQDLKINSQIKTVTKCDGRGTLESYIYASLRSVGNDQYWIDGIVRPFDFLQIGSCDVEFYVQNADASANIGCVQATKVVTQAE